VFPQVQQVSRAEAPKGSGLCREGFNYDVQVVGVVAVVLTVD
jgi:hypothetical protein